MSEVEAVASFIAKLIGGNAPAEVGGAEQKINDLLQRVERLEAILKPIIDAALATSAPEQVTAIPDGGAGHGAVSGNVNVNPS